VLRGVCTMIHYFLTVRQDSSVEHVYEYNQELDDVYVTADGVSLLVFWSSEVILME